MHNDYHDIENRLREFRDFEFGVTNDVWSGIENELRVNNNIDALADYEMVVFDDIWSGIENELVVDNNITALADHEMDVTDDIWEGIEDRLKEKDRKPIIWWVSRIAASLVLFTSGAYLLYSSTVENGTGKANEMAITTSSPSTVGELEADDISTSSNSDQKTSTDNDANEANSLLAQHNTNEETSSTLHDIAMVNGISSGDGGSTSSTHNTTQGSSSNGVSSTSNTTSTPTASSNGNTNTTDGGNSNGAVNRGDMASNSVASSSQSSASGMKGSNSGNDGSSSSVSNSGTADNNTALTPNANPVESTIPTMGRPSDENGDQVADTDNEIRNSENAIASVDEEEKRIEEEEMDELTEVGEHKQKEEEENETKERKWRLLAGAGIGNTDNIEIKYQGIDPPVSHVSLGQSNNTADAEMAGNFGKSPVNELRYSIPININLGAELDVTKGLSVGLGVTYTSLKSYNELFYMQNETKQKYIAIPLTIAYDIKSGRYLDIRLKVFTRTEKMVKSEYTILNGYEGYAAQFDVEVENSGVNIATGAGLDVMVKIHQRMGVSISPQFSTYLKTDTQHSYRRNVISAWPEINMGIYRNF